ncbi:hypothetical protein D3C78_1650720 [compost metagenome]
MGESYTVMPGVLSSTCSSVLRFWSSSILRVITVTDCGVSFSVCTPLPMVTAWAVYDWVPSLVASSRLASMFIGPSSMAEPFCAATST